MNEDGRFRVGYLLRIPHQAFLEATAADPRLEVRGMPVDGDEEAILAFLAGCHGYYVMATRDELPARWHLGRELLKDLPNLLLAVSYGAGFDTIDAKACSDAGVGVVAQGGGNANGVAEHTIGMMLALANRIPVAHAALRAGGAARREDFLGRELHGRTVGLVGIGHIGTRVATLAGAFGCRVLAVDPYLSAATCAERGASKVEMATLLAESDVVSLHCPLNDETRGMIGAETFAAMRPGTIFVSTARGGVHDEDALLEAIRADRVAGAGLDVWVREPPDRDDPLLNHPRVIASPHTAGVTGEGRARVARMAAEAFICLAAGTLPPRLVDPAVGETLMRRRAALAGPGDGRT